MANDLFTVDGQRKYLTEEETRRFLAAAGAHERGELRTLCLVLVHTGCRISEAFQLTTDRVDLSAKVITFRTLKQRGKTAYRSVPVPDSTLDALELVHRIRKAQNGKDGGFSTPLWMWSRSQASFLIASVMKIAGISGPHASPKGLRHGFGVRAATQTRNPRLVQKWLGHRYLETTTIYRGGV